MNQLKLILFAALIACGSVAGAFEGKVIAIADGDTLTVLTANKQQIKVRLSGIDPPEKSQAFGMKAKQALSTKVFGKVVRVQDNGQDRYKRTIGDIYLGQRWVNLEMVQDGYAWHYKQYSSDTRLAQAEASARESKSGLWIESHAMPPWEYRAWKRSSKEKPNKAITGYWLNEKSGVRHNSNCLYYQNTTRGRSCRKIEGKPCGNCGG